MVMLVGRERVAGVQNASIPYLPENVWFKECQHLHEL